MSMKQIKDDIAGAMAALAPKTNPYDTEAEVVRVEGGTAWVHIPGGVDETPVALTINAKEGDTVRVRVGGGSAWIVGNATAPPTDDTAVRNAVEGFEARWAKIGTAIIDTLKAMGINADWINAGAFTILDGDGNVIFKADATEKTLEWNLPYSSLDTNGQLRMYDGGGADDSSIEISGSNDALKTFMYANGVQLIHDRANLNALYEQHMDADGTIITETDYVSDTDMQSYTEYRLSLYPQIISMIEDTYVNGSLSSRNTVLEINRDLDTYELNGNPIATTSTPTFTAASGTTVTNQTWSQVGNIVTGDLTITLNAALQATVQIGTLSAHPGHMVIGHARTATTDCRCSINDQGTININSATPIAAGTTIFLTFNFIAV